MSQERFDALIAQLCAGMPPEVAADARERGLLSIDGTDVLLACDPSGHCRVLIDLGPPPLDAGETFYRRLLELNLEDAAGGMPVLSIEADSGHVVAIIHASLSALEQENRLTRLVLEQVPGLVQLWQAELVRQQDAPPGPVPPMLAGSMELRP